jgi:hypothetical protein
MMRSRAGLLSLRATAVAVVGVISWFGVAAVANAAGTPSPSASPTASPTASANVTATLNTGVAKIGDQLALQGTNWPPGALINAQICGNDAAGGSVDCALSTGSVGTASPTGTFNLSVAVQKPPVACPCVVNVSNSIDQRSIALPLQITGVASAPLTGPTIIHDTLSASARIVGSGPWTSWIGGSADRTALITVTNTGNQVITNPTLTLTVGKGADPTTFLANPQIGTIQPGQTVIFKQPFTIKGPAFGQYRLKGVFSGLDEATTFTASTSVYPWILFVLAWLLLQIPLLGLYKRRSVIDEGDEDPIEDARPVPTLDETYGFAPAAAATALMVGAAPSYLDEDPLFAPPAPAMAGVAAGAALVGAHAVPGPGGAQYAPVYAPQGYAPQPAYAAAATYGLVTTAAARPAVYRSGNVVGVDQLRWLLMPGQPYAMNTVAPRIVVGGVIPSYQPELPPPPPADAQAAYLPMPNGMTAELPPPAPQYYSEPPAPQYYSEPPAPQYYSDPPAPQYPTEYPQY